MGRAATGPCSITYYLVVPDNTCFGNVNIPGCVVHIIVAPLCTQQKHMSVGLEGGLDPQRWDLGIPVR